MLVRGIRKLGFLFALIAVAPGLLHAESRNYYAVDYYTDVSGSMTVAANLEQGLSSGNSVRAGVAWMDAKTTALGKGASLTLGLGSDVSKPFYFGTDWTYWRFPGNAASDGLDVVVANNGLNWNLQNWSVGVSPIVRTLRFVKQPNQTIITSAGLGYSATYFAGKAWSVTLGGEESNYYGNPAVMQTIFQVLRASGNAPFVSNLVISRTYVEFAYQMQKSSVGVGYDNSKVVIAPNKYSQSLYVDYRRELNSNWSLKTSVGTGSLDGSDWFGSVGLAYRN